MVSGREFLGISRRFVDLLGADGLGDEYDQRSYAVDGVEPRWTLFPASAGECAAALRVCSEHGLAVVPAGLGARLGQGNPPERIDVVVSLKRMDAVVDQAAADMTLTVQGGASLAAANARLRASGQWLPFDPPFAAETSIGGLVAAQASGPCRHAFGTARESLIGLSAVLADGTAVKSGGRVVKNVAGYDLQKLFAGSFGTLGLIVEATFKLRPAPEDTAVLGFRSNDPAKLFACAERLARSSLAPLFLEILAADRGDLGLAVGLGGFAEEVVAARTKVLEAARDLGDGEPLGAGEVAARIEEVARPAKDAIVFRAGTLPAALGEWLRRALERARGAAANAIAHAHAGVGVCRVRLEEPDRERSVEAISELRRSARDRGGYLVVESAPPEWKRALDVWGDPPPGFDLMKGVKAAFDPARTLSPGRFVGGL